MTKPKSTKSAQTTTEPAGERVRLQVICSREQEKILSDAASAAGFAKDRSAWILGTALRAAKAEDGALTITGDLADKVRAAAAAQGVSPEKFLRLQVA